MLFLECLLCCLMNTEIRPGNRPKVNESEKAGESDDVGGERRESLGFENIDGIYYTQSDEKRKRNELKLYQSLCYAVLSEDEWL